MCLKVSWGTSWCLDSPLPCDYIFSTKAVKLIEMKQTEFLAKNLMCNFTLRKHAYSNTLKILLPKNGNFSDKKILIFFIFLLKTEIVGTR